MSSYSYESNDAETGWTISNFTLTPTLERYRRFCASQATNITTDPVFTFSFARQYGAQDVQIHESKLLAGGGPLTTMVSRDFRERSSRVVSLSPEDDPTTFGIIRNYLYCDKIILDSTTTERLINTICAVHRWQLMDLFRILCCFLSEYCDLPHVGAVMNACKVANLPDLPAVFKDFFWKSVGRNFDGFKNSRDPFGSRALHEEDVQSWLNARFNKPFPGAWDLAVHHNMVGRFLNYIRKFSLFPNMDTYLLELIMVYLEPRISDDKQLQRLIDEQMIYTRAPTNVFKFTTSAVPEHASPRALRLVALSLGNGWHLKYAAKQEERHWEDSIWPKTGHLEEERNFTDPHGLRLTLHRSAEIGCIGESVAFSVSATEYNRGFTLPRRIRLHLRFNVDSCGCLDAPRVGSQICDVSVYHIIQWSPPTYFDDLSKELSLHSRQADCTAHFWCTYSDIE